MFKICEYCQREFDGKYSKYTTGRFCSKKCARGFSSRDKRQEINRKVSLKLKGRETKSEHLRLEKNQRKALKRRKLALMIKWKSMPFEQLTKRAQRQLLLEDQNFRCSNCRHLFIWFGYQLIPELHHKDGNDKNRTYENSELLCPNCHSVTKNYAFRGRKHTESAKKIMRRTLKNCR